MGSLTGIEHACLEKLETSLHVFQLLNILKPEGFTGCYDVCYQAIV